MIIHTDSENYKSNGALKLNTDKSVGTQQV
jgi:hypothetical protein